jgi:hypothetical protein
MSSHLPLHSKSPQFGEAKIDYWRDFAPLPSSPIIKFEPYTKYLQYFLTSPHLPSSNLESRWTTFYSFFIWHKNQ